MREVLTEQELHNLAMNTVGDDLQANGYEFLAVNSKLKKDPQFVALKDKMLHFVVVRAVTYPNPVQEYDKALLQKMKEHAQKFDAKTYYAGVGLGHGTDYQQPAVKGETYSVLYNGITEV